jgi:hypothetical protein
MGRMNVNGRILRDAERNILACFIPVKIKVFINYICIKIQFLPQRTVCLQHEDKLLYAV